ncbi:MAG: tetratricopeptide repeat protein [Alphaproteobacteria bacterium]
MALNDDRTQEALAAGITEDITTALTTVADMDIVAGEPATAIEAGRDTGIGAAYTLSGKVQCIADRVRIWAKLTNVATRRQLWAERFEGRVKDVLALQDRVTLEAITALRVSLTEGQQERISLAHGTRNLEAWLLAGQGHLLLRRLSHGDILDARALYERAIELDPAYAGSYEGLAWTHLIEAQFGWASDAEESLTLAEALAGKALEIDRTRGRTLSLLGHIAFVRGDCATAIAHGEQAVRMGPHDAEAAALLALTLNHCGSLERSRALMDTALRLSPNPPRWHRWNLGRVLRLLGRLDEAIATLSNGLDVGVDALPPRVELVLALMERGDQEDARALAAQILARAPDFSVAQWFRSTPCADHDRMQRERYLLRAAGLPD